MNRSDKRIKASYESKSACKGLRVEGLCKKYKRFQLKDVSFDIPPGSILGLLGRNGAGKTTAIKILAGHTRKSSGKIQIDGVDMDEEPVLLKSRLGFMLEEPMFFEERSLWENGVAFGRFYEKFTEAEWKKWLSICRLQGSDDLKTLSKGDRMKFQFAFAMAHHPVVLLLDEPTGNLDPVFRKEFLEILQEVVEEQQVSVLLSSHLTADLEQVADRVALMEQGAILYTDSMERMKSRYCLIKGSPEDGKRIKEGNYPQVIGIQITRVGFEAMLDLEEESLKGASGADKAGLVQGESLKDASGADKARLVQGISDGGFQLQRDFPDILQEEIDLSKWMYYMTKGGRNYG